jgi:hypothetical protein
VVRLVGVNPSTVNNQQPMFNASVVGSGDASFGRWGYVVSTGGPVGPSTGRVVVPQTDLPARFIAAHVRIARTSVTMPPFRIRLAIYANDPDPVTGVFNQNFTNQIPVAYGDEFLNNLPLVDPAQNFHAIGSEAIPFTALVFPQPWILDLAHWGTQDVEFLLMIHDGVNPVLGVTPNIVLGAIAGQATGFVTDSLDFTDPSARSWWNTNLDATFRPALEQMHPSIELLYFETAAVGGRSTVQWVG